MSTVFRTEITPDRPEWSINYSNPITMMGSCFAEHIGSRLSDRQFQIDLNPFGVLFNPVSIAGGIQRLINQIPYSKNDLFFRDGLWHSFDHHSRFSGIDITEVLERINRQLEDSAKFIRSAGFLFLTFGTARVYHHKASGRVVSNCHKIPAAEFDYSLLRVGDVVRLYSRIIQELSVLNPDIKIVLTISPVRYWKDGANGNQLSKSTLLLSASELVLNFKQVSYFPAYEIFMDDLRDYRFYDEDLVHPAIPGINYVWNKFTDCYFSEETSQISRRVEKIMKDKSHRPLNPESESYSSFLQKIQAKIDSLKNDYPQIDFHID
jgi:hypothetical protein